MPSSSKIDDAAGGVVLNTSADRWGFGAPLIQMSMLGFLGQLMLDQLGNDIIKWGAGQWFGGPERGIRIRILLIFM